MGYPSYKTVAPVLIIFNGVTLTPTPSTSKQTLYIVSPLLIVLVPKLLTQSKATTPFFMVNFEEFREESFDENFSMRTKLKISGS